MITVTLIGALAVLLFLCVVGDLSSFRGRRLF